MHSENLKLTVHIFVVYLYTEFQNTNLDSSTVTPNKHLISNSTDLARLPSC